MKIFDDVRDRVPSRGFSPLRRWFGRLIQPYSLFWRVLIMFLLVVIVAVVTMEFSATWLSDHHFKNPTELNSTLGDHAQQLAAALEHATQQQSSFEEKQSLVEHLAQTSNVRIILVDQKRHVVADSLRVWLGRVLMASSDQHETHTISGPHVRCWDVTTDVTVPVLLAYEGREPPCIQRFTLLSLAGTAWHNPIGVLGYVPFAPERLILASFNDILLVAMLLGGGSALLLAVLFSLTLLIPLRRLTRAVRQMERGDLRQRVHIPMSGELTLLGRAFNTMAHSLENAEQLRRTMVSDVAHELRTPLTTIQAYLDAIEDGVMSPSPETISSLQEESLLLGRLVCDLQELSLADAGKLSLDCHALELAWCIQHAVHSVFTQAESKSIHITVDLPVDLPLVSADSGRVGQILRNLLANALAHTPPHGKITIGACAREQEILVSIWDTGEGVEAQHVPYLFDRFYRVDASRSRRTGGTGLGLAIVKQLVLAQGGQVGVESERGKGSHFFFTLLRSSSSPE